MESKGVRGVGLCGVIRRRVAWLRAVALGVVLLGFASCGGGGGATGVEEQQAEDTARVAVRTMQSELHMVPDEQLYSGQVRPFEQNYIATGVPGRIDRLLVDVGDRVRKGQLLVVMDGTQLATLRAQLATLERDFARLDTLHAIGSVAQQQYEQMRTQRDVTREQVANLERNVRLTSPIDGVVTGRYFNEGELFSMAPTPESGGRVAIVAVMQLDPVKVSINIPENLYPKVQVGMGVSVKLDAYGEREFAGSVYRVNPTVDALSHTVGLEVRVPNGAGALRPGMFARVCLTFGQAERVLVPDMAVVQQRGTNEKYVYEVVDGAAVRRVVTLGRRVGAQFEILDGLSAGADVVVSGMRQLHDGCAVRVTR